MFRNEDYEAVYGEKKRAIYSIGMEDAVVDLVVIQWIMAKLKRDRRRNADRERFDWHNRGDEAQSA